MWCEEGVAPVSKSAIGTRRLGTLILDGPGIGVGSLYEFGVFAGRSGTVRRKE